MSTYYDFMVEAKYNGKWYNIDLHTKDIDGKLRHQYLATFSRSFIGQLENLIDGAWRIGFDDLAESSQNLCYPVPLQSVKIAFDWSNFILPAALRILRYS